ncbi:NYN domain-containing protein [Aromatoleum evansii]|nr:NYN domain-containing protein [Aromatoleum evansii]NMG30593.1 NYN domain-containing protein [Aromatoleum evansii]
MRVEYRFAQTTRDAFAVAQGTESVALYWDFENLHASLVDQKTGPGSYHASRYRPQDPLIDIATIMEFALSIGPLAINRAFANWVSFNRYKHDLLQSAIELIQVFPPGAAAKNGADIKLCLDVLDDMNRFPHIGTIIVVGGDSDFMPLSYKVKAAGRTLIGIGSMTSTNQHWARSCHQFQFYETLLNPAGTSPAEGIPTVLPPASEPARVESAGHPATVEPEPHPEERPFCPPEEAEELRELLVIAADTATREKNARELISKAISRLAQSRGDPWVQKAGLRPYMQRMDPTFHESNFGYSSFSEMLKAMGDIVETRRGKFDHELRLRNVPQAQLHGT